MFHPSTPARGAVWGGGYGLALTGCGLLSAGAGHGAYLPISIFGAPLSLIPIVGLFAPLILWPAFGLLIGQGSHPWRAWLGLAVHLVSVGLILAFGSAFESGEEQWQYLSRVWPVLAVPISTGFAVYVAGLIVCAMAMSSRRSARFRKTRVSSG